MPAEDRASQGMLIGLAAVTVPAAVYCLLQTWHLVGGDTLRQAIQAFAR